ncbi:hypothetical protein F442_01854 [Plasmopara halstedii]|uniref:Phox homologous domain n=1 Tax=Plasmopara halstedii TaxID=4781 RepID=A0A0P1AVB5_PLAHL|nr:hypothetical protein F442_01854 [Plasmopara halstedii]CEG44986.1 hypothetical protein F442_01854 [Plasmopara halstedii]|eukprot:XP_024581355.1 hypothetical protein F442_01854 [Plasmopara halstedii]
MVENTIKNLSKSCGGSAPRSAASLMRVGPVNVPEAVAWLDNLTLELNTASTGGETQYELTMKYAPSELKLASCAMWTISHTFDEYRHFRKRLLKCIQQGHSCGAECKWLIKVIKQYFPQKFLFGNNFPKVVAIRRKTLIRCLTTVQASLVNRGNHGCRVLVQNVATEFNCFVAKGIKDIETRFLFAIDSPSSDLSSITRDSLDSESVTRLIVDTSSAAIIAGRRHR